jgi:deoxyribodipyrimidine photo-lyase
MEPCRVPSPPDPSCRSDAAPVILWFRHDLRLDDHPALDAALITGRPVLPVFILDEAAAGEATPDDALLGGASRWWLHHSLAALAASLARAGAELVLRRGDAAAELADLVAGSGATEVFTARLPEPWARRQDQAVARALAARGARLRRFRTTLLFDPEQIRTQSGGVYGVYSPFARACFAAAPPPEPRPAPADVPCPPAPRSDRLDDWKLLPSAPDWADGLRATWTPGEAGARVRLDAFLGHAERYADERDMPGLSGTSMLSPHLRWGEISPGRVWHAVRALGSGKGVMTYLKELLWREFSAYLLFHHPQLPEKPLRPEFAAMPWRDDAAGLAAWQRGRTGVPIVDAGMRQLWRIGWMHNRVRMIVASYLVKHLLIPWQLGAAWFSDTLVDADLASNSASWQWVAGCGADAAPYFRVFNPVLQGRKFDPDGAYVRAWVPELATVPNAAVHAPWEAGHAYAPALVDLAEGRARALAAYASIGGKKEAGLDG